MATKQTILIVSILLLISIAVTAQTKTVEIKSNEYFPEELTIKKGMTVLWINKESSRTHQVYQTYNKFPRSPVLFPQDRYNYTFEDIGTFEYRDAAKPSRMIGNIIVVAEEDYVEEEAIVNKTNESYVNNTNQTVQDQTINDTTEPDMKVNQTEDEYKGANETKQDPVVLETPQDKTDYKPWIVLGIVLASVLIIFFVARFFIQIKPIEIKQEYTKKGIKVKKQKTEKAKVISKKDGIAEIRCPSCGNTTKTVFTKSGAVNLVCDNCGADLSADIKT